MSRKPTLDDALLLALLEAGVHGLDVIKWYFRKPLEFNIFQDEFFDKIKSLEQEGLVEHGKFGLEYKLTEKGKFRANNIENEINSDDYISLITRVSPEVELRKRLKNLETFVISIVFVVLSYSQLQSIPKIVILPLYISTSLFVLFLIVFVFGIIYSCSSLIGIIVFWAYYTSKYGKIRNKILILYKEHERTIKFTFRFIVLPVIALLITIFVLGMTIEYSIGTLILTIIGQLILPKQN